MATNRMMLLAIALVVCAVTPGQAQYFGRNKPVYQKLDFKVHETDHFRIYDYLKNPEKLNELSASAERWYDMHMAVLEDSFSVKNPMLIYSDHAGFQQTNAIQGDISVGTGGVTEGLRNRVVFPVAMTNQQTDHVMGHELVHAFQYHMILEGDSTSIRNMANMPLWMVEGLAEYLSIGRIDANTAMWMRDAVLHDKLPRIKDLDNPEYFPYRWGQAFWAYIAGVYGDEMIRVLFMNTAKYGLQQAVRMTFHVKVEDLSDAWQTTLKNHYGRWAVKGKKEDLPGKKLLSDDNAGKINISPILSPSGKYVIFLSEKNLFTTDLFLADAKTGKIIKKVTSSTRNGDIDQYNYIESAGTWSPDDKKFAFDVYEKGRSVLVIKDIFKGKKTRKVELKGVPAFSNPTWSPDGKTIVVSGLVNGQTDLYAYDLKSKKVRRLTNDRYAEILPSWSADGRYLAYSTDQFSLQRGRTNGAWKMNLAIRDMTTDSVEMLDLFPGADNMNPQFDHSGNLFFLSDRDGFRNLYRYDRSSQKTYQLTKLMTGISGITPYSPAITVAEDRDRILYTYYSNHGYEIYQAKAENFQPEAVDASVIDMIPATLPPFDPRKRDVVNTGLRLMGSKTASLEPVQMPYKRKFALEYLGGSAGVGVMTGNRSFGNASGALGGIDMLFNDILGNNQLYVGAALNGEIQDAAFQASYINRKHQIGWGVGAGHIPYVIGGGYLPIEKVPISPPYGPYDSLYDVPTELNRQFVQQINAFAFYPLSVTKRVEIGASTEFYSIRQTIYHNYYTYLTDGSQDYLGQLVEQRRERGPKFGPINIYSLNTAFVGDNSYFGMTAPLQGWRYRIALEQYFGYWNFSSLLLDGREYFRVKPFTFAVRGMAYGRFGGNSNENDGYGNYTVQPLFVAQPWFVRGYPYNLLVNDEPGLIQASSGSKMLVANAEIRLPFTGPRRLALIPVKGLMTDLNLFFDAGMAYFTQDDFNPTDQDPYDGRDPVKHKPLLSVGASLRVNLFNAIVLEPYVALPLTVPAERRTWQWGLNFIPGW